MFARRGHAKYAVARKVGMILFSGTFLPRFEKIYTLSIKNKSHFQSFNEVKSILFQLHVPELQ